MKTLSEMRSINTRIALPLIFLLSSLFACALITGCGGGGGDDSFVGAASVTIDTSPDKIDTGDRTLVRIEISDVNTNGISLKLLYADALEYVNNSSYLTVDGIEYDLAPSVNMLTDDGVYLLYYLSSDTFGEEGDKNGILEFQLEAKDTLREGVISVDADVDDPEIPNSSEFNPEEPEFLPEAQTGIEVEG